MFEVDKPIFEVKMTPKYLDLPKSIYIYQIIFIHKRALILSIKSHSHTRTNINPFPVVHYDG